LEPVLDASDLMTHAYNLEISSPGINRVLKKTADFERFNGQRAHVKLYSALDGQKNFHGTLQGADDESLRLKTDEGRDVTLPRNLISKARLDPVIEFD
jgi:ribosome maturation factor RimP